MFNILILYVQHFQLIMILKIEHYCFYNYQREGDYSLYGDYGQSNYGTLDGKGEPPLAIEIPPEAIDEVFRFRCYFYRNSNEYNLISYTIKYNNTRYYFQIDAGEAPRGEKSKIIKTEHGELKSKYHYLGFGLWQNTNPIERYVPKKPSPPPPKAEPIWYDCTVSVETHKTSKELDDLMQVCILSLGDFMQVYLPMHVLDLAV